MGVQSFDHVGVVVDDLGAATAFFLDLGLKREGGGPIEGEWVDKVVGARRRASGAGYREDTGRQRQA
jgi:hypothetical protein